MTIHSHGPHKPDDVLSLKSVSLLDNKPVLKSSGWTMLASVLHWLANCCCLGSCQERLLSWVQWASPAYYAYHGIDEDLALADVRHIKDGSVTAQATTTLDDLLALSPETPSQFL
jgi:hypothetical protein